MNWIAVILVAAVTYLFGSLNMALLISKFHKSKDIRDYGSGNAGMTNMLRTFGPRAAGYTFAGDFLKGALAVVLSRLFAGDSMGGLDIGYVAALFVILGHIFPVFFGFRGGKGVATALGVMVALDWMVAVPVYLGLIPMVFIIKIVSAVSLCGAAIYPVLTFFMGYARESAVSGPIVYNTVMALVLSLLVFYAHRDNVKRLIEGKELSFGGKSDEKR